MEMISVRSLLIKAFLTGWEQSDKSIPQREYLESSMGVIEMMQVDPHSIYVEEGLGLLDGDEVDHLDDLMRTDGVWLYYGVNAENFFLLQWYADLAAAQAKLTQLEALGDGKQYLVDLSLQPAEPLYEDKFSGRPNQLRS